MSMTMNNEIEVNVPKTALDYVNVQHMTDAVKGIFEIYDYDGLKVETNETALERIASDILEGNVPEDIDWDTPEIDAVRGMLAPLAERYRPSTDAFEKYEESLYDPSEPMRDYELSNPGAPMSLGR